MKKSLLVAALLAFGTQHGLMAAEPASPAQESSPLGVKGGWVTTNLTAKVIDVNKDTRQVTLMDDQGRYTTVVAGDEVRNFNQIEVGDRLDVKYTEALAVAVFLEEPGAIGRTETIGVSRADLGQKPHGTIERTVDITARISALDKTKRIATLTGSKYEVTLKVAEDVDLAKINVGDTVRVKYIESLALSVNKP